MTHKVHGEHKRWQAVRAQRTVAHDEGPVARGIGPEGHTNHLVPLVSSPNQYKTAMVGRGRFGQESSHRRQWMEQGASSLTPTPKGGFNLSDRG